MIMLANKIRKLRRIRFVVDVDTQNHYFLHESRVCVQNHRKTLTNILRIMHWARLHSIRTISTVQILNGPYRTVIGSNGQQDKVRHTLWRRHISFDANDSTDLPQNIFDEYEQAILHKRCFDPFEEPRADRMLSEYYADEFILVGAATEGAVKATALGLLARRKRVTVVTDAIGSYDKRAGETIFRRLRERGAKLVKASTIFRDPYYLYGRR